MNIFLWSVFGLCFLFAVITIASLFTDDLVSNGATRLNGAAFYLIAAALFAIAARIG